MRDNDLSNTKRTLIFPLPRMKNIKQSKLSPTRICLVYTLQISCCHENSPVFAYNGLGDRLQQIDGVTTTYTLDLNARLTQVLADGTTSYLYGLGRIAECSQPLLLDEWQYHLPDALGSVRQLADASGTVSNAQSFEPYGEALAAFGAQGSAYGFAGEWTDVTGMQYLRARYYAPQFASFITADEFDGLFNYPASLNKHNYAYANPIVNTDPDGKCPKPSSATFESSSGSIICIAAFIPTEYSEVIPGQVYYTGDNRDFSFDSDSSRIWMWIDANTGELIDFAVHKTCRVNGEFEAVRCNDPHPVVNDPTSIYRSWLTVDSNGNDTILVNFGIICNDEGIYGYLFCSFMFTGKVDITRSQGMTTATGTLSRFPNYEGWLWQSKDRVVKLFTIQNFSPEELQTGIGSFWTAIRGWATKSVFEALACTGGGIP